MTITDNKTQKRFETTVDDIIAFIDYILVQDKIFLTHTEVPKSLEGKGIGKQLVALVLKEIEEKKLKLIPLCPFVAMYIKNNPSWAFLVSKSVNIK
jgi:predicted GNAT family acetyltransferase